MARWLQVFRREQIHVIDGDQLIINPLPELVKIETFLGLRHRITKKNLYYDKKKGFYCVAKSKGHNSCLGKGKGHEHPEIAPKLRKQLKEYFAPLNQKFFEQVQQTFSW